MGATAIGTLDVYLCILAVVEAELDASRPIGVVGRVEGREPKPIALAHKNYSIITK